MFEVRGTAHKQSPTDFHQACAKCGRLFYFTHNCNGRRVICPHCGHKH